MPVSVSPRRHGVSKVLFGSNEPIPSETRFKPQSVSSVLQSSHTPLPTSLAEIRPSRSTMMLDRGGSPNTPSNEKIAVSPREVGRGVSPNSGKRRTVVGQCNVPSYVVAAVASGVMGDVVFSMSPVGDPNRRQPPKFTTSTSPLTDRDMGICTMPHSPLVAAVRTGSPVRGSVSPRRNIPHPPAAHRQTFLNGTLTAAPLATSDDALPLIGTATHKAPFFPDASYWRSSKRPVGGSASSVSPDVSPGDVAVSTGSHPGMDDRGAQSPAWEASPGRILGSIPSMSSSPTLRSAIQHVPTRSGTNPIYPLEDTRHLVQADAGSAMFVSESGRMMRPSLPGYTSPEAEARDASVRRKWARGERRAHAEKNLFQHKEQEATQRELSEEKRIAAKRTQREVYVERLLELQRWEAKKIRQGHI